MVQVPDQPSGRARAAMAHVVARWSHDTIDNLYTRFELDDHSLDASDRPSRLKKANHLVRLLSQRGTADQLLRHVVDEVLEGTLDTEDRWQRELHDAMSELPQISTPTPLASQRIEDSVETSAKTVPDRRAVFLVHGRDLEARDQLTELLHALDLRVIPWRTAAAAAGGGSPYTGDIVDAGMRIASAVVVLFTPDDMGFLREEYRTPHDSSDDTEPTGQARLNVVFEAGMAMAIDRRRVVLVEMGRVRRLTDTDGVNVIRMTNDIERRKDLAARLRATGLAVDTDGEGWREAGNFNSAAERRRPAPERRLGTMLSIEDRDRALWQIDVKVLEHLASALSSGVHRVNTPFEIAGLTWQEIAQSLSRLRNGSPPFIEGVMSSETYPVVITGLTERGWRVGGP